MSVSFLYLLLISYLLIHSTHINWMTSFTRIVRNEEIITLHRGKMFLHIISDYNWGVWKDTLTLEMNKQWFRDNQKLK